MPFTPMEEIGETLGGVQDMLKYALYVAGGILLLMLVGVFGKGGRR
jgi:hypothetical protein